MFNEIQSTKNSGIVDKLLPYLDTPLPKFSDKGHTIGLTLSAVRSFKAKVLKRINANRIEVGSTLLSLNDITLGLCDEGNEEIAFVDDERFTLGRTLRSLASRIPGDKLLGFVSHEETVRLLKATALWDVNHAFGSHLPKDTMSEYLDGVDGFVNGGAIDAEENGAIEPQAASQ